MNPVLVNAVGRYIAAGILVGIYAGLVFDKLVPPNGLVQLITILIAGLGVVHAAKTTQGNAAPKE